MTSTPSTRKRMALRQRARQAPDAGAWPGATYPACTVSPDVGDPATLDGLVVPVDPRLWLAAPPSWTPSQLSVNLALAAMWILGAKDCSARWFGIRCCVPAKELPAALATAARGPGHPVARVVGNKVVLERADAQLRRPALYWRLPVADVARCRDAQAARAWLILGYAAASVSARHALPMSADDARWGLALRPGADPLPPLRAAADALAARFVGYELVVQATTEGLVVAAPRTVYRARWARPEVLGQFGIADGRLGAISLAVGQTEALRAWMGAREERGLDGHFAAVRSLWLAVVAAASEGIESPLPCYSTAQLRSDLARGEALRRAGKAKGAATKAFDAFVQSLAEASGAAPDARRPLLWMLGRADAAKVFAARGARARGDVVPPIGPVRLVPYRAPEGVAPSATESQVARAVREAAAELLYAEPEGRALLAAMVAQMDREHPANVARARADRDGERKNLAELAFGTTLRSAEGRALWDAYVAAEGIGGEYLGDTLVRAAEQAWGDALLSATTGARRAAATGWSLGHAKPADWRVAEHASRAEAAARHEAWRAEEAAREARAAERRAREQAERDEQVRLAAARWLAERGDRAEALEPDLPDDRRVPW